MFDVVSWIEGWFRVEGPLGLLCVAGGAFVLGLSGALVPGPLLVLAVREGVRRGGRAGLLLTLGHGVLELAAVVLIYGWIGDYLGRPLPKAVLALGGGLALLIMAAMMLAGLGRITAAELAAGAGAGDGTVDAGGFPAGNWRVAAAGALVSISNPYWSIWWATVGMGCIAAAAVWGWIGMAVFFAGHVLADLVWYWLVAAAVFRGRRLLTDRSYRALVLGCALLMLGFAAWFGWVGARGLRGAEGGPPGAASPAPAISGPAGSS